MKPMQISIHSLEPNYIRFQVRDDPHTLFNLMRMIALEEKGVVLAGYARDRTFEESVMFQIRTEGKVDPREVLVKSARKISEMAQQFKQAFEDEYH